MLDIELAGAVAPGAHIVVYFAPNTDQGFHDALTTAVHDNVNTPSVISISWGSAEANWTSQAMTAMDAALQDAGALGVTVAVASGDDGSTDGLPQGNHVDFPRRVRSRRLRRDEAHPELVGSDRAGSRLERAGDGQRRDRGRLQRRLQAARLPEPVEREE